MSELDIGVLAITAPCISFSLAGKRDGWSAKGAIAFSLMIAVAALLGIKVLVIENVANIDEEESFKVGLYNRLKNHGYCSILKHQFNTKKFRPLHRNRVILIAYLVGPSCKALDDWKLKPSVDSAPYIPCQEAFLMNLPSDLLDDVRLEPFDLQEYCKMSRMPRSYIPRGFTHHQDCNRYDCRCEFDARNVQFRTWNGVDHLSAGSVMASYTSQHKMPGVILGQLVDQEGCRFLHPVESLVNAGITERIVVPREVGLATRIVGNMITEFHALLALLILLQAWPLRAFNPNFCFDIANFLVRFQKQCINKNNLQFRFNAEWIEVWCCEDVVPMDIRKMFVHHVEVSPTLPFQIKSIDDSTAREPSLEDDLRLLLGEHINDTHVIQGIPDDKVHWNDQMKRMWQTTFHGPAIAQDEMTFYLELVARRGQLDNFGAWSCCQILRKEAIDAFMNNSKTRGKIAAVLVNKHWRIIYIEPNVRKHIHWFYSYRAGDADRKISEAFKSACERASGSVIDQTTHLGVGICGWCGWDAIEACLNHLDVQIFPHEIRVQGVSFETFAPEIAWCEYHDSMQHPIQSIQILSLLLRTLWLQEIVLGDCITLQPNFLGFGDQTMKGRVTGLMITKGHAAEEALRVANEICKLDLPAKESNAIGSRKPAVAYPAILHLRESHGIKVSSQKNVAVSKLQKFWRSKVQKKPTQIDLAMLIIPTGTFAVGESPVEVNRKWSPTTVGVSLATRAQIEPYLQQGKRLTSKCNSVVLGESIEVQAPFAQETHVIKASDPWGGTALVRITIVHLGDIPATRSPIKEIKVTAAASTEIILTVHRHLWTEEQWGQLSNGPLKMLLGLLFNDTKPDIQHVGFRRWSLRRAKSTPEKSDYSSVMLTVKQDLLEQWLRLSGLTSPAVFVSPKLNESNQDAYRVIWLGRELPAAISSTPRVPDHLGLIYKVDVMAAGKASYGIRVCRTRYASAYPELRPDATVKPSLVQALRHYVLQGLPRNISREALDGVSSQIGWGFRLLKKKPNGDLLVGAEKEPPHSTLIVNGKEVMINMVESIKKAPPMIVAGKLRGVDSVRTPGEVTSVTSSSPSLSSVAASGLSNGTGANVSSVSDEQMMNQGNRISALEVAIADMQSQMKEDRTGISTKVAQVEARIDSVTQDLSLSLKDALDRQSKELMSSFSRMMKGSLTPTPRDRDNRDNQKRDRSPTRSRSPKEWLPCMVLNSFSFRLCLGSTWCVDLVLLSINGNFLSV